MEKYNII